MFDGLKAVFTDLLSTVLNIFPTSPFTILQELQADGEIAQMLRFVNWFVPVNIFVAILEGWLVCVAVYYVWQVVLRWIKAVE